MDKAFVSLAPVRIGCLSCRCRRLGALLVLPFLCCWSALVGRLSVLECASWTLLLLFALLHLFPVFHLFVKQLEAGPGNPPRHTHKYEAGLSRFSVLTVRQLVLWWVLRGCGSAL